MSGTYIKKNGWGPGAKPLAGVRGEGAPGSSGVSAPLNGIGGLILAICLERT